MDVAQHNILSARSSGMTPRRALIIGTVGLLHAGAIYAIVVGMRPSDVINVIRDIQIIPVAKTEQPQPKFIPPTPHLTDPIPTVTPHVLQPPVIDTVPDRDSITTPPPDLNPPPSVPDTAAASVPGTHSTPPYPAIARNLSHAGQVLLQLVVSERGDVTQATVVTSSGFGELDEAAVSWVVAHWKYRPAIQNGQPIPSQTQAIVKFDLTQARR
jgi:protein TonB